MKSLIVFITLITSIMFAWGQNFAPVGAKWHYSAQAGGMAPQNSEYYLYESQKDTIVANHFCKKLTVTYYKYLNADTAHLPPVFVYQSMDTVYYYNNAYQTFFPLYLFNVSQGDTLNFHSPDVPFNPADTIWKAVVDSVTDFMIGANTLKRVWTTSLGNYSFHGSYIEKIGSDFLMFHQPANLILEHDGPIRCYRDDSISYNFTNLPCDYRLTTGINEFNLEEKTLLYPNPTDGNMVLEYKLSEKENGTLIVLDITGKIMQSYNFNNSNSTMDIDANILNSGVYLYDVYVDNNKVKTDKIIVAK